MILTLAIFILSIQQCYSDDAEDILAKYTNGLATGNGSYLNKPLDPAFKIFACDGSVLLTRPQLYQAITHPDRTLLPTIRDVEIIEVTTHLNGTLFFKVRRNSLLDINDVSINEYMAVKGDDGDYRLIWEKHANCQNKPVITSVMDDYLYVARRTIWDYIWPYGYMYYTMQNHLAPDFSTHTTCLSETTSYQEYVQYLNAGNNKFILYGFNDIKIYNASRTPEGIIHFHVETKDFTVIYGMKLVEGEYKISSEEIVKCQKRPFLSPLVDESRTFKALSRKFAEQYSRSITFTSRKMFKSITWDTFRVTCGGGAMSENREEYFNKYLLSQGAEDGAKLTEEMDYNWMTETLKFSVDFSSGRVTFEAKLVKGNILLLKETRDSCLVKAHLKDEDHLDKMQHLLNGYVTAINNRNATDFFQFATSPMIIYTGFSYEEFRVDTKPNFEKIYPTELPDLMVKQENPKVLENNGSEFHVIGEWAVSRFDAREIDGKWLLTTERRGKEWQAEFKRISDKQKVDID